jgi:hypothetical protein
VWVLFVVSDTKKTLRREQLHTYAAEVVGESEVLMFLVSDTKNTTGKTPILHCPGDGQRHNDMVEDHSVGLTISGFLLQPMASRDSYFINLNAIHMVGS